VSIGELFEAAAEHAEVNDYIEVACRNPITGECYSERRSAPPEYVLQGALAAASARVPLTEIEANAVKRLLNRKIDPGSAYTSRDVVMMLHVLANEASS
jgi:hypothetical protein